MYLIFVATPGAFIASVLGLIFDKRKWPAVLTMLLSGGWVILMYLRIFNLC